MGHVVMVQMEVLYFCVVVFTLAELLTSYRRYGVLVIAWWSWMGCDNTVVACGTVIGNRRIFLQGILVLWA